MADSNRYADWFKKAQADLNGAKILFEHEADYSLVAFHCQQAIEKALKGFILKSSEKLLEGHSLVYLVKQAALYDDKVNIYLKECAFVNQFYVATRYPADMPDDITCDEAERAIEIACDILKYLL